MTAERPANPTPAHRWPGGLLAGRRILVTGVLTPKSIAYAIADACLDTRREVILTSFGRAMSLTERSARRLGLEGPVLEMDATRPDQVAAVAAAAAGELGRARRRRPRHRLRARGCPGRASFMTTPWESVAIAMQVSAFSLKTMAAEFAPLMPERGGSMVTLTFDATVAWPLYDWMGPTKAALESIVRYLARDLGSRRIRVNSLSAGPLETIAARADPRPSRDSRTRGAAWPRSAGTAPTPPRSRTPPSSCSATSPGP